jgi:hypothetical protein
MPHRAPEPPVVARRPLRPAAPGGGAAGAPARAISRAAFYAHLWLGVLSTVALLVIAVTGVLLNHKRALGLMPDVAPAPTGAFDEALPLARLARIALDTVARAAPAGRAPDGDGPPDPVRGIDRMDVRPRAGYAKVRLRDAASTEVTVDLASGRVLHVGPRGDVFLERMHSGEVFGGQRWVLLSDAAALALIVTLGTGYWLWLAPKRVRPGPRAGDAVDAVARPAVVERDA